jgi:hypothetical protein
MRFVFFDPTNEKDKYYDFVNLKIESSQETLSGLCKWASLQVEGTISGQKDYNVITDPAAEYKRTDYFIPSKLSNFDAIDDECGNKIEMSLETYVDAAWTVLTMGIKEDYVEGEYYTDEFLLYRKQTGGVYASVAFDTGYFNYVQFMYRSDSAVVDVPMRIGWRDDDGNPVEFAGFTNEFTLHVKANLGSDNDCTHALLEYKGGVVDKYLTFRDTGAGWSSADISFEKALTVALKADDASIKLPSSCYFKFALYVWDKNAGNAGEWKTLKSMLDTLRKEITSGAFSSTITFDSDTSDFHASFFQEDIIALTDRFTENDVAAIIFKAVAFVPGSTAAGATVDLENLIG